MEPTSLRRNVTPAKDITPPEVENLMGLLQRILDAETYYRAAGMGGARADENMGRAHVSHDSVVAYARSNDFEEVVEVLEDLRPVLAQDLTRGLVALRELRCLVRLELDATTQRLGLPLVPPADIVVHAQGASPSVTRGRQGPKVGRNDPCPCGSGKKSKKCCGKPGAQA